MTSRCVDLPIYRSNLLLTRFFPHAVPSFALKTASLSAGHDLMDTIGGLDLADLDAVTVADQPRAPYYTGLAGAKAACEWRQATETVTLYIPVRPGTLSRNLAVQIKAQRLHVAYRGTGDQLVLEAELGGR